jgi:hypothetical protein
MKKKIIYIHFFKAPLHIPSLDVERKLKIEYQHRAHTVKIMLTFHHKYVVQQVGSLLLNYTCSPCIMGRGCLAYRYSYKYYGYESSQEENAIKILCSSFSISGRYIYE